MFLRPTFDDGGLLVDVEAVTDVASGKVVKTAALAFKKALLFRFISVALTFI
jgi:hypothetical protein